jgi:hypothetical protein
MVEATPIIKQLRSFIEILFVNKGGEDIKVNMKIKNAGRKVR